jgi:hypothetical protein
MRKTLADTDHVFRRIKKSWCDGDFIDPAAFRLHDEGGTLEAGLSVNWREFFKTSDHQEAAYQLTDVLEKKKNSRRIGGESKYALLNVGQTRGAAQRYVSINVILDEEEGDPSHSLIVGYETYNDQVSEEIAKVFLGHFATKRPKPRHSGASGVSG